MKREKTLVQMRHSGDAFMVEPYRIIPIEIYVKGYMIQEDADRIFDQIKKSAECSDVLINRLTSKVNKPKG